MLAGPVRAQSTLTPDEYNALVTAVESTPSQPAIAAPIFGNFYTITHGENWPPLPSDTLGLNFWSLGGNYYLLDDRDYGYNASWADFEPPPSFTNVGSGGSGGNPYFTPPVYTTNELWLQITTNLAGSNAILIIHPPSGVTEGVYDVLTATNLTQPIDWQWLLRTDPGQTNLPISIGTNAGTFYALGKPNDLVANDSLGTNFWLVFPSLGSDFRNTLSLYISSPLGASGTVTIPNQINGSLLIVSNCGDTNVNGTYVLTNMLINPFTYGIGGDTDTNGYVFSHYVAFFDDYDGFGSGFGWVIADANTLTVLFDGSDSGITNLNDVEWFNDNDPDPAATPPTTTCAQDPLVQPFTVTASNVTQVPIPLVAMIGGYNFVGISNAINVQSSAPVSVYAFDYESTLSAAFTAFPVGMLGTNYCVLARPSDAPPFMLRNFYAEIAIVATEDGTDVTIKPYTNENFQGFYGTTTNIVLDEGQVYQVQAADYTNDVTGTTIGSDKPIAVFAGANNANVPNASTGAANPITQEQIPVEDWGTNFLGLSFAGRTGGDSYRILAAQGGTDIYTNGVLATSNLLAGEPYDTNIDGPVQFTANKPIQVAQFANGATFANSTNTEGDPCEILLPPAGHYLDTNIVVSLGAGTGDFDQNFLNVIVPEAAMTNTKLDGNSISATNFVMIGGGYYGARLAVTNAYAAHRIISLLPVCLEAYGWGMEDAYGYIGGTVK